MMLSTRRNDLFSNFLNDPFFTDPFDLGFFGGRPSQGKQAPAMMKTDIKETDQAYQLEMDLPGFSKENVNAQLENGYLTIEAATSNQTEDKDESGTYLRKERFTGSCKRSFYVGEDVSEGDISASFENGILSINVPKKQPLPEPETKHLIEIA